MPETVLGLRVRVTIDTTVAGTDGAKLVKSITYDKTFGEGTGTDQIGSVWVDDSRALNTTSEDLDLSGGGLIDFQGTAMALNNVKVYYHENLDTDSGDYYLLKQGSTAPVTSILGGTAPTLTIGPGGIVLLVNPVDGYAVTATTADKIAHQAIDNSTSRILIAGDNA